MSDWRAVRPARHRSDDHWFRSQQCLPILKLSNLRPARQIRQFAGRTRAQINFARGDAVGAISAAGGARKAGHSLTVPLLPDGSTIDSAFGANFEHQDHETETMSHVPRKTSASYTFHIAWPRQWPDLLRMVPEARRLQVRLRR
jgi:hypothetical protein